MIQEKLALNDGSSGVTIRSQKRKVKQDNGLSHTIVVCDAHLQRSPDRASDQAFHRFLRVVPDLGTHLVLNGDVFDFWFEYRSVIPRSAFRTLAALSRLRELGIGLTVTGGNHDRWGGDFFQAELGTTFHRESTEVDLSGFRALVRHGDGIHELHRGGRVMHAITRLPITARMFRLLHPDVGFWFVRRMSSTLSTHTNVDAVQQQAADAQLVYATGFMQERRDIDLLVLGHTHRPAIVEVEPRRWYLNPGAWMDDLRYAVVTPDGPELGVFED